MLGQYWTGGSNPNLNAGRDRIDRRTYSNPLIGFISPIDITGSDHLCRFSILIPFSFLHRSPSFLLAHLRAQLIDPRTLIILASARCCFGPAARSASAHSAQQSRCTHAEAHSALSFHPPSTPSSLSLIRLFSHLALPLPARSRVSVLSASKFEQKLFAFVFVWSKAHCRTAVADSVSVPLAALVPLASASPSCSISDLADRLSIHDFAAVKKRIHHPRPASKVRQGMKKRCVASIWSVAS